MMVNDRDAAEKGELRLTLEKEDGTEVARASRAFDVAPLGTLGHELALAVPGAPDGTCSGGGERSPAIGSRQRSAGRKVTIVER